MDRGSANAPGMARALNLYRSGKVRLYATSTTVINLNTLLIVPLNFTSALHFAPLLLRSKIKGQPVFFLVVATKIATTSSSSS